MRRAGFSPPAFEGRCHEHFASSANSDFTARQPVPGPMTRSEFSGEAQATSDEELESLIRRDYERCHPGETLDDLKRRAAFSKGDRGLLRDWMAIAAAAYRKRCRD